MRFVNRTFLIRNIYDFFFSYPAPSNLSYMWNFGIYSLICLMIQIITGVFLAMHYVPEHTLAFYSVEYIMREVFMGWFIRYVHANGASMFFLVVYIHTLRSLYYNSYMPPRASVWIIGVVILLLMIITAFLGYVLPWGQMSFWAATVITSLVSSIPVIGETVVVWLWGGYAVDDATLNRFFSLHYLFPFAILGLVAVHLVYLHDSGSNNPLGFDFKHSDHLNMYPYFIYKDVLGVLYFLIFFGLFLYFMPNLLGHSDNYIVANPLVTPSHIVPEWYFLPFYAILRSFTDKFHGVIAMVSAVLLLALLPFIVKPGFRSSHFIPLYRITVWIFLIICIGLGWIGGKPAEAPYVIIGQTLTAFYFIHWLVFVPFVLRLEGIVWEVRKFLKSKRRRAPRW